MDGDGQKQRGWTAYEALVAWRVARRRLEEARARMKAAVVSISTGDTTGSDLPTVHEELHAATSAEIDAREWHHVVQDRAFERHGLATDASGDPDPSASSR